MKHCHRRPTASPPLHRLPEPIKGSHTSATLRRICFFPQAYSFLHQSIARQAPSTATTSHRRQAEPRCPGAHQLHGKNPLITLSVLSPSWRVSEVGATCARTSGELLGYCRWLVHREPPSAVVHKSMHSVHRILNTKINPIFRKSHEIHKQPPNLHKNSVPAL
jgi:hypothetical protein